MNKFKISLFLFLLALIFAVQSAKAESLITLNKDWKLIINVLAAQDQLALSIPTRSKLQINKVSESSGDLENAKISLYRDDDNMKLSLETTEGRSNLDVTNYKDSLIEIEETPEKQNIKIYILKDNFQVQQGNIKISTKYPIEINPETKKISLKTESGDKYLSIMPKQASEIALRAKTFSSLDNAKNNELIENDGLLVYKLNGTKTINLFNITDYVVDVEGHVNASNGEVTFTNEAIWVKLLSFFLT